MSQRAYIRGMARAEWRKALNNWEQSDPKKRGAPPKKPKFEDISEQDYKYDPNQLLDIEDMPGANELDIQYIE